MRLAVPMAVALLAAAGNAAAADDAALQRCRAMGEAAARLACYDAIPLGAAPAPRAAPAPSGAPAAAAPAAQPSLLSRFGFENRAQPEELASVESHIPGRFEGWAPMQVIKLANGQAWQVVDGTSRTAWVENPKVVVRRGAMGAFYLEIDRVNPSPRVRRVQ